MDKHTPLAEIKSLASGARDKLSQLGAMTLDDVAQHLSRAELKHARRIGPKTIERLEQLLADVGLTLREEPGPRMEIADQVRTYNSQMEQAKQALETWVAEHEPKVMAARQEARTGAFGDYVRAQIRALDHIEGPPTIKRELEHQLVRMLNRYQREQKYAKSKNALRDGMYAKG